MTGPVLAVDQGTSGTKALVICPERGVIGTGFAAVRPLLCPAARWRPTPPNCMGRCCDTVVFTGDFVPETELARRAALTLGPRTSRPGVFAVGGLLQPGVDARTAAREGVRVGRAVLEWLARDPPPPALTDP